MEGASFFHYRTGKTFLHKTNPAIKIILMVILAFAAFYVPPLPGIIIWATIMLISVIFLHFTWREVFTDSKPMFTYLFLVYTASIILNLVLYFGGETENWHWYSFFMPSTDYIPLLVHLCLSMEITSVFYRTTSILDFRTGFRSIENVLNPKARKNGEYTVSDLLCLTINFIPSIARYYQKLDLSWKARGGNKSIRKITCIVPGLFRKSMEDAQRKTSALQARA